MGVGTVFVSYIAHVSGIFTVPILNDLKTTTESKSGTKATAYVHVVSPSSSNGIHYPNASFIIRSVISIYLRSLYSMIAPLFITNYKNVRHVE